MDSAAQPLTRAAGPRPADRSRGALTFVSVVFEPELDLLDLQARSFARFVDPQDVDRILVIDNTARGLGEVRQRSLLANYGALGDRVMFLRPEDIATIPASAGWTSQQVLKLLAHRYVETEFYVVLDAKNHFVRRVSRDDFVNPDGRARGASHTYRSHALRPRLQHVLGYLGLDAEEWLDHFPVTHTPFVMESGLVADMIAGVSGSADRDFAEEFVAAGLLEFFLYSGWMIKKYGDVVAHLDGSVVRSGNVWPGRSSAADFSSAVAETTRLDAPFLAIHRTALAKAGLPAVWQLAGFWEARGLFGTRLAAVAFIVGFKVRYARWQLPKMLRRLRGLRRRQGAG